MQYRFKTDQDPITVDVEVGESDTLQIANGPRTQEIRYARISDHQIHLEVDGVGVNAFVAANDDGAKEVVIGGVAYHIQNADQAGQNARSRKGARALPTEVTPPMPSVVERLMVAEGQVVNQGDGVVVVSAMKMELTLDAPFNGRVTKVNVSVGDKVMPGQILVDIEREVTAPKAVG